MDEYPIPVTSMKDLCDVEISLDTVTVTTKRKRVDVLGDPLDEYSGMEFEVYGVENYLMTICCQESPRRGSKIR